MLLISYGSVAGWFEVWSICVKAQLTHPSHHVIGYPSPSSAAHTPFACLTLFFLPPLALCSGRGGSSGKQEGLLMKTGKCESAQEVAPTCTNPVKITTFVTEAVVMRGISIYRGRLEPAAGLFNLGRGQRGKKGLGFGFLDM